MDATFLDHLSDLVEHTTAISSSILHLVNVLRYTTPRLWGRETEFGNSGVDDEAEGFLTAAQTIIRNFLTVSESVATILQVINDPPLLLKGSQLELNRVRPHLDFIAGQVRPAHPQWSIGHITKMNRSSENNTLSKEVPVSKWKMVAPEVPSKSKKIIGEFNMLTPHPGVRKRLWMKFTIIHI
jgi:hypothetical protein